MSHDKRPTNWGCLSAIVLMTPVGLIVFGGSMISGGGCEGREQPCVGDYTPVWIMMGAVVAVALGLAFAINVLVAKVHVWRNKRTGS
jgi:hypothetical protein